MNALSLIMLLATALPGLAGAVDEGRHISQASNDTDEGYVAFPLQYNVYEPKPNTSEAYDVAKFPLYTMNLPVGSNHQNIPMMIVLQFNQTVLIPPCVHDFFDSVFGPCNGTDRYNASSSTTFKNVSGIEDPVLGQAYSFTDDIQIGMKQLHAHSMLSQEFGFPTMSGYLGLADTVPISNKTFRRALLTQGLVQNAAFSFDMRSQADNKSSSPGSIIFGGIDHSKYACGHWKRLQTAPGRGFDLHLRKVSAALRPNATKEWDISVLAGEQAQNGIYVQLVPSMPWNASLRVPGPLYDAILEEWPGVIKNSNLSRYLYTVPCKAPAGTLDFTFEGQSDTVQILLQDLIGSEVSGKGENNASRCDLNFWPTGDTWAGDTMIGDSFFQSSYVVFDLEPGYIHFTSKAECGSNITAFGKAGDNPSNIASLSGGCGCTPNVTNPANPTTTTTGALPKKDDSVTIPTPLLETMLGVMMFSISLGMAL